LKNIIEVLTYFFLKVGNSPYPAGSYYLGVRLRFWRMISFILGRDIHPQFGGIVSLYMYSKTAVLQPLLPFCSPLVSVFWDK
jgi:hypothetical protein